MSLSVLQNKSSNIFLPLITPKETDGHYRTSIFINNQVKLDINKKIKFDKKRFIDALFIKRTKKKKKGVRLIGF